MDWRYGIGEPNGGGYSGGRGTGQILCVNGDCVARFLQGYSGGQARDACSDNDDPPHFSIALP